MPETPENQPQDFRYTRAMRLSGGLAFKAVYDANTKKHAGPVTLFAKPSPTQHHRLGLSVSRKVGTAVKRNKIKRMLREAFRLTNHTWPASYDIVIVVRPHTPLPLPEYQSLLTNAITSLHKTWSNRPPTPPPSAA